MDHHCMYNKTYINEYWVSIENKITRCVDIKIMPAVRRSSVVALTPRYPIRVRSAPRPNPVDDNKVDWKTACLLRTIWSVKRETIAATQAVTATVHYVSKSTSVKMQKEDTSFERYCTRNMSVIPT